MHWYLKLNQRIWWSQDVGHEAKARLKYVPWQSWTSLKSTSAMILAADSQYSIIEGWAFFATFWSAIALAFSVVRNKLFFIEKRIKGVDLLKIGCSCYLVISFVPFETKLTVSIWEEVTWCYFGFFPGWLEFDFGRFFHGAHSGYKKIFQVLNKFGEYRWTQTIRQWTQALGRKEWHARAICCSSY